jgi:hypothetical protein
LAKFGAFHSSGRTRRSRFLVASLVEPGSFEIEKMHELRCPGVSMFMVLPGPREPLRRSTACSPVRGGWPSAWMLTCSTTRAMP